MSKRKTIEDFKKNGNIIHNNKYDYSLLTSYTNANEKHPIICHIIGENNEEHGVFYQSYAKHIHRGHGCPKCAKNGVKYNNDAFIKKLYNIWGDKYKVSENQTYTNAHTKMRFICNEHGEFETKPYYLLQGHGCPICGINTVSEKLKMEQDDFIKKSVKIHNNKYNYNKIKYTTTDEKVCIICPKHGEFWQTPHSHLSGRGCPVCNISKLERKIHKFLEKNKIQYIPQQKFDWLGQQRLDFYLPDFNVAIECQGEQHYIPSNFGSKHKTKEELFEYVKKCDEKKYNLCKNHDLTLIYFANIKYKEYFSDKLTITNINDLKKYLFNE